MFKLLFQSNFWFKAENIHLVLSNSHRVRARTLAKVSCTIIAMTPAVDCITQIMTRCMFSALNQKLDWNNNLNIYHKQDCIRELMFWKLNISNLKPVFLLEKEPANTLIFIRDQT
jgi:hypothetical protein